jgi:hypothetical protein
MRICIQSTLIMSNSVNTVNAANLIEIIWHKICTDTEIKKTATDALLSSQT